MMSGGVNVGGQIQLVLYPGVEVVGAVRRRGVDHARALVHGDVVGQHAEDRALKERDGRTSLYSSFLPVKRARTWVSFSPHSCR